MRGKKSVNFFLGCGDFTPFFDQKFSNLRPLLSINFPKDSKSLKSLDIGLHKMGEKRRLNKVNK